MFWLLTNLYTGYIGCFECRLNEPELAKSRLRVHIIAHFNLLLLESWDILYACSLKSLKPSNHVIKTTRNSPMECRFLMGLEPDFLLQYNKKFHYLCLKRNQSPMHCHITWGKPFIPLKQKHDPNISIVHIEFYYNKFYSSWLMVIFKIWRQGPGGVTKNGI